MDKLGENFQDQSRIRSSLQELLVPLFGSHLSIAGGYDKAADAAAELGMQTVQISTKA